jgi:hypothetical protein
MATLAYPNTTIFNGNYELEKYVRTMVDFVNSDRATGPTGPTGATGPSTGVTGPTGATGPTGP